MSSGRKAFFRNGPTPVDDDQNALISQLLTRTSSLEGRTSTIELTKADLTFLETKKQELESLIAQKKAEALAYTDNKKSEALAYADDKKAEAITYADNKKAEALSYVDDKKALLDASLNVLSSDLLSKEAALYSDILSKKAEAITYVDDKKALLDASLNVLSSDLLSKEAALYADILSKKAEALAYTDDKKAEAISYIDDKKALLDASLNVLSSDLLSKETALYADILSKKAEAITYVDDKKALLDASLNVLSSDLLIKEAALYADILSKKSLVDASLNVLSSDLLSKEASLYAYVDAKQLETTTTASEYTDDKDALLRSDIVTGENNLKSFVTAFKDALFLESQPNTDVEFNYTQLLNYSVGSSSTPPPPPTYPVTIVAIYTGWDQTRNNGNGSDIVKIAYTSTANAQGVLRYGAIAQGAPVDLGSQAGGYASFQQTSTPLIVTTDGYLNGPPFEYFIGTSSTNKATANFSVNTPSGRTGPYGQSYTVFGDQSLFV